VHYWDGKGSGFWSGKADLSEEAIRLTRIVYDRQTDNTELSGLLALMLLTDARSAARTGPNGELIPLAQQNRALCDRQQIAEGGNRAPVDSAAQGLGWTVPITGRYRGRA